MLQWIVARSDDRLSGMQFDAILFDLDNTLYPAASGVGSAMEERMNAFVQRVVGCDAASARALRRAYYERHGTTLRGLQNDYRFDVEEYLRFVHDLDLEALIAADADLDALLDRTRATKAIFTNAPEEHARRVLRTLGIERHFDRIFDIRFAAFLPKPHPAAYQRALETLGMTGPHTALIEDSPQNLGPARDLGMFTVLIGDLSPGTASLANLVAPDVRTALHQLLEA
ncbi:MAG TPA: pyrimidine 5'-nucleotidase [Roseiflexaceae bacterium]|nr:pyrimidine 5'-nucleotidase [Roseiflexaceae bacterium]